MKTLQEHREARGWSRAELARRACMNASTVGAIEQGRLRPYPSQLEKLTRALSLPAARGRDLVPSMQAPVELSKPGNAKTGGRRARPDH